MKSITIVIPVYNEQYNVKTTFEKLEEIKIKYSSKYNIDFLFADNNSTDETFAILKKISSDKKFLKIIKYSRNYGYQRSIFEAIKNCHSDAAVIIDCDLQDPPEMIFKFVEYWEKGFKNIYGLRNHRDEKWVFLRSIFYKVINKLSEIELPQNAGDFRLIDKVIIEKIKKSDHDNPYVRGIIASFGYKSKGVSYTRQKRKIGKSNANFFNLLNLAINSITQFSTSPIRALSLFGFFVFSLIFLAGLILILFRFIYGAGTEYFLPKGFTTTWLLILLSVGINSLFFGIIGEYVASIHREILKLNRVNYDEKINFEDDN